MSLAQRLDELATANADGLLNDDEYRLLRKDAFERYAGSETRTTGVLQPIRRGRTNSELKPLPVPSPQRHVDFVSDSRVPPPRTKTSVTSGVASFFRKATGRKNPGTPRQDQSFIPQPTTPPASKKTFIPRLLSRKSSSDLSSLNTGSSGTKNDTLSLSSQKASTNSSNFSIPTSPTRSVHTSTSPSKSRFDLSATTDDLFEDGMLGTTREIRQAILDIETKWKKVMEAFDGLECSALKRLQRQNNHRHPSVAASPPLPSLFVPEKKRSIQRSQSISDSLHDTSSLRSINSSHTTKSTSQGGGAVSVGRRSQSSRNPPKSPTSPLAPHHQSRDRPTVSHMPSTPNLQRKGSVSSVSSQATSLLSVSRLRSNSTLSRSTSHLPMNSLVEEPQHLADELDIADSFDGLAEINEIRRRREEVKGRYQSRLEYLRARLKGAELHEKLLKR